ncbi:carbohydrate deacetylase isoform X2 [Corapipo altera]|uniref:carbohydrate deacetylase isoform X2 n=1 Tax=Corapipo altera TaxID=415028 RepID=UPI000FD6B1DB|nr:carbohydrate deacetylase isoform X2 [Corapipo altera]
MLQVKLIVTGDDFGYCPRRNQGIVDCFLAGAISNVSLLVNGSAAADAAKLARRYSIPIGLHANLSEGSPVCEVLKTNSSLLNQDGFFHGKMGFRTALSRGLLNMSEVKQELKAQVELFHELTGHLPPHMDGHQHVHVLPEVRHVFAEVLEEYGIKYTRVPVEPGLHNCDWIPPSLMDFYLGVEEDSFNTVDVFTKHGISASGGFWVWLQLVLPVGTDPRSKRPHPPAPPSAHRDHCNRRDGTEFSWSSRFHGYF